MNLNWDNYAASRDAWSKEEIKQLQARKIKIVRKPRTCLFCGRAFNSDTKNFCTVERDSYTELRTDDCRNRHKYFMRRIGGKDPRSSKALSTVKAQTLIEIFQFELIQRKPVKPMNEQLKSLCNEIEREIILCQTSSTR